MKRSLLLRSILLATVVTVVSTTARADLVIVDENVAVDDVTGLKWYRKTTRFDSMTLAEQQSSMAALTGEIGGVWRFATLSELQSILTPSSNWDVVFSPGPPVMIDSIFDINSITIDPMTTTVEWTGRVADASMSGHRIVATVQLTSTTMSVITLTTDETILDTDARFFNAWAVMDPSPADLCNGDGGDQMGCTNCPCMNNAPMGTIGGCTNSAGSSSRLHATGDLSASLPAGSTTDLRFSASGMPPTAFGVLISGAAVAPANAMNPCFGQDSGIQSAQFDGLRCAIQSTQRHGGRAANAMGVIDDPSGPSRVWGGESQPNAGIAGQGGFAAGQTRYFQVNHREDAMLGCMRGLNSSQAVRVVFEP